MNIWYGTGENKQFSNLAERRFAYTRNDLTIVEYVSVEHAYQTMKSGKFDEACYNKPWKDGSKFLGHYRANYETNMMLMYDLILESFKQNDDMAEELRNSWPEKFTHIQDRGVWNAEFPRLLTEVRNWLLVQEEA